jgi:hypothetical protein
LHNLVISSLTSASHTPSCFTKPRLMSYYLGIRYEDLQSYSVNFLRNDVILLGDNPETMRKRMHAVLTSMRSRSLISTAVCSHLRVRHVLAQTLGLPLTFECYYKSQRRSIASQANCRSRTFWYLGFSTIPTLNRHDCTQYGTRCGTGEHSSITLVQSV